MLHQQEGVNRLLEVGERQGNERLFVFVGGFNLLQEVLLAVARFESALEDICVEARELILFDLKDLLDWVDFDHLLDIPQAFYYF